MLDRRTLNRRTGCARSGRGACAEKWRDDLQRFAAHDRTRILFAFDVIFALQPQLLHRTPAASAQLIEVRTFVHDGGVAISDVGHVGRFIDDRDVLLHGNDGALNVFVADVFVRHEDVFAGFDVIIIIGPMFDAGAFFETRFRRQRRPADMLIARAPRNPGRRPFVARDPNPTDIAQARPTSVVIGSPAKRLIGNPGPTGLRVSPAAVGIGAPIARLLRGAWLPDITVIRALPPRAIRFEFAIKCIVRLRRTFIGR